MSVYIDIFYSLISESEWTTFCVFASAISLACAIWNDCFQHLLKLIEAIITDEIINDLKGVGRQLVRENRYSEDQLSALYAASRKHIGSEYKTFGKKEQKMFSRFYDPSALSCSIIIAILIPLGCLEQLGSYNLIIILFPYILTAIVFTCDCKIFIRKTTAETEDFLRSGVAAQKQQLHKDKRVKETFTFPDTVGELRSFLEENS